LDRTWYLLIRPPRTQGLVALRDDGMTLVDGKPFFPIGLYAVWKKPFNEDSFDKAFADIKAAGFNMAHTYNSGRGPDFAEFYAAAQRHGIKLYVASGAGANCTDTDTVLWDVAREEAQPALLAWYLADDTASHVGCDELRAVSEGIHDIDPAHITVQADGVGAPPISRYTRYVASTDGFLPELYPIRDNSDKGVPQIIADMKTIQGDLAKAGTRRKAIWAIVQYFQGWGWPRYPTRQELWAMSYLSIIHGANGITWYTYGGHGNNHGVTDNQEVWKNICDLAGELSKLRDVLVEPTGALPSPPTILSGPERDALGYPSISFLLKEHAGKRWLLTANSSSGTVSVQFPIPKGRRLDLPFEGRQPQWTEGGFTDTFVPYGVHVYLIE
jgi:sugar phosphate isomerase/epimerase